MEKRDVIVSEEVYWSLVDRKFAGQYRSIDEVLRPMLGIRPGARPRLKKYQREQEYMKEKTHNGDPEAGKCPHQGSGFATGTSGEAFITSLLRNLRFLSEATLKWGGGC